MTEQLRCNVIYLWTRKFILMKKQVGKCRLQLLFHKNYRIKSYFSGNQKCLEDIFECTTHKT